MSNRRGVLATVAFLMLFVMSLLVYSPVSGWAAITAPAPATSSVANDPFLNQLIKIHDLKESLRKVSAEIKSFAKDLRTFGFPPEAVWMTKHILLRAYEPKKFLNAFTGYMAKDFSQAHAMATTKWFLSPLGKKFYEMEEKGWSQEAVDERIIYSEMLFSFPPPEMRLNLVERLEEAWQLTDLSIDRIVPIVRLWFPHRDKLLDETPRTLINTMKKAIREPLREGILKGTLYTFLDLSDEELKGIVEFAESDAGKWYGRVFQRGLVVAFDEQVLRSQSHLDRFISGIESGEEGIELLKENFPPGERYIALRKRDPFQPLIDLEGKVQPVPTRIKPKEFKKFRGKLKDFPTIPFEIYKKIKKDSPELYANLEYYQELFNDQESLQAMTEDEYSETVELYRELIDKANRTKSDFVKTPLQGKYEALAFVGVIWNGKESLALVELEGKKGHTVKKGNMVGPNFGVVDEITSTQIVVIERSKDYLGEVLAKRKKIKFSSASEGSGGLS